MKVEYTDSGEHYTVMHGSITFHFSRPKDEETWNRYKQEAKKILKQQSKTYNAIGLDILVGAILEELP